MFFSYVPIHFKTTDPKGSYPSQSDRFGPLPLTAAGAQTVWKWIGT